MSVYFAIILGFAGALWWFNHQRQQRLNADPGQRRLAELLIAAAGTQSDPAKRAAAEHLAQISRGGADRRVRLTHAVLLVRSTAPPETYARVLELSRGL